MNDGNVKKLPLRTGGGAFLARGRTGRADADVIPRRPKGPTWESVGKRGERTGELRIAAPLRGSQGRPLIRPMRERPNLRFGSANSCVSCVRTGAPSPRGEGFWENYGLPRRFAARNDRCSTVTCHSEGCVSSPWESVVQTGNADCRGGCVCPPSCQPLLAPVGRDKRDTSSIPPRFIRHWRRFGEIPAMTGERRIACCIGGSLVVKCRKWAGRPVYRACF